MSLRVVRLVVASTVLGCGCDRAPEPELVAEAAALNRGIDTLRQAPNPTKPQQLTAFSQVPCSEPKLCRLKRECERAYQKHVAALRKVDQVKKKLEEEAAPALHRTLDAARSELIAAEAETQACVALQAEMQERYGLKR